MSIQDDDIQNDPLGEQFDLSCIEALAPILEIVQKMEPPVVKREARYLSGNDIGKTINVNGEQFVIEALEFDGHVVDIYLQEDDHPMVLTYQTQITITGKEQNK